jgi:hypothetical protein
MFVARSAARVRLARLAFLLLGLAPAAGLVAWAVHRRSDGHRAAIERRWQEAIGLPLAVGRVEHPRPGVIRGLDCVLPAAEGRPAIAVPLVEVESSADEDRIRIGRFACDATAAAVLATLGREWLADEVRFRRTCLIEVADFSWAGVSPPSDPSVSPATPLRVECVVRPDGRAVRIVRRGRVDDELRIVRGSPAATPPESGADPAPQAFTITATCSEPVPLAVLAVASGAGLPAAAACGSATVTGTLEATRTGSGWAGSASGGIADIDLAAAAAAVGGRATGTAAIDVTRLAWSGGRVTDALFECVAGAGGLDGRLFDRIVLALGARPGPAAAPLPPGGERGFDAAACIVGVGPHGVQVLPTTRLPAGLATSRGDVLLLPPAAPVPGDRIAWMLSAPGTTYGPAIGPGSWLISVLPGPSPQSSDSGRQF